MQLAGWIGTTTPSLPIPEWAGLWSATFPAVQTLLAQASASRFVICPSFLALYMCEWRPARPRPGTDPPPGGRAGV
jgi:hypothetical protein